MSDYERVTEAARQCCKQLYSFPNLNAPGNLVFSVHFDAEKLETAMKEGQEAIQPLREVFRRAAQTTIIPKTGGRGFQMCGLVRQTAHGLAFAFAQKLLDSIRQGIDRAFYTYSDIQNLWPLIQAESDDVAKLVSGESTSVAVEGSSDTSATPVAGSQTDAAPQPFKGGEMVFHPDRVELCGVDICSGTRAKKYRTTLELLAKKDDNGAFKAYSCQELAELVGISPDETEATRREANAAGHIRHLRRRISKALQIHANIQCDDEHVIRSGRQGYHFDECVSVQYADRPAIRDIKDIDESDDVRNVRDKDVPNVPNEDTADASATRRAWILQQLTDGVKLKAPDVAEPFKCHVKTAQRDLKLLKNEGKIEHVGAPRTGYYRLCQPPENNQ